MWRLEWCLIGILASVSVQARDPFTPPVALRCLTDTQPWAQWRLQGISQSSAQTLAWFVSPQGELTGLRASEPLGEDAWRIVSVQRYTVVLQRFAPCENQFHVLHLPGGNDEKDSDRQPAAARAARATAERQNLAGVRQRPGR